MVTKGQLIRSYASVPKSMLSSTNRFSRSSKLLGADAVNHWKVAHRNLLRTFGVNIIAVEEMEIIPAKRAPGPLEVALSQKATLAAALPALAVALKGRGDLLNVPEDGRKAVKTQFKEIVDLRASATELEVFYSVVEENPQVAFVVRVGEGGGEAGRRKPGEALNASLYPGQIIANKQYRGFSVEQLRSAGVKVYEIATDPIDGTTKTVMGDSDAITSLLVVDGEIAQVPDVYMEKLTLGPDAARSGLDTNEELQKIVQGISDLHRVPVGEINVFTLNRERHPIEPMQSLGVNVVTASDCDLITAPATSANAGIYENGFPLRAMMGDTGGAPEYIIGAVANNMLGGESHGRFVSAKGMKEKGWDGRYDFNDEDREVIEGAGLSLEANYPISQLVDFKDGIAAFGGITANSHFPQLSGVFIGDNYAQVDVLLVRASGRLTKRRITFEFLDSHATMIEHFSPITEVIMNCDILDIRGELRKILDDPGRKERLHREIGLSLYHIFEIHEGKFKLAEAKMQELGDERTQTIVKNLMKLTPEWFV